MADLLIKSVRQSYATFFTILTFTTFQVLQTMLAIYGLPFRICFGEKKLYIKMQFQIILQCQNMRVT